MKNLAKIINSTYSIFQHFQNHQFPFTIRLFGMSLFFRNSITEQEIEVVSNNTTSQYFKETPYLRISVFIRFIYFQYTPIHSVVFYMSIFCNERVLSVIQRYLTLLVTVFQRVGVFWFHAAFDSQNCFIRFLNATIIGSSTSKQVVKLVYKVHTILFLVVIFFRFLPYTVSKKTSQKRRKM